MTEFERNELLRRVKTLEDRIKDLERITYRNLDIQSIEIEILKHAPFCEYDLHRPPCETCNSLAARLSQAKRTI